MTLETMQSLRLEWEATGRVAHIYPRLRQVSLNGRRAVSFEDAAKIIRELSSKDSV